MRPHRITAYQMRKVPIIWCINVLIGLHPPRLCLCIVPHGYRKYDFRCSFGVWYTTNLRRHPYIKNLILSPMIQSWSYITICFDLIKQRTILIAEYVLYFEQAHDRRTHFFTYVYLSIFKPSVLW